MRLALARFIQLLEFFMLFSLHFRLLLLLIKQLEFAMLLGARQSSHNLLEVTMKATKSERERITRRLTKARRRVSNKTRMVEEQARIQRLTKRLEELTNDPMLNMSV